jgi:hypothetical protein
VDEFKPLVDDEEDEARYGYVYYALKQIRKSTALRLNQVRRVHNERAVLGRAVQVDPIEPTLKAPGTERLKLKYDEPPSNFALKFKLRRYNSGRWPVRAPSLSPSFTASVTR